MIGFIGCGNLSGAILKGMKRQGVYVYDISQEAMKKCQNDYGALPCGSIKELTDKAEAIVIGVKPQAMDIVLSELRGNVSNKLLITFVAGYSVDDIEKVLGSVAIVRALPNLNATVSASMTCLCSNKFADDSQVSLAEEIFSAVGKVMQMEEKHFGVVFALAGSTPAFVFLFIEALTRAGIKLGLSKQSSYEIASQVVLGSALNLSQSSESPADMIDRVCSPGGMTIEGLHHLLEVGFEGQIITAVERAAKKYDLLNKK